MKKLLILLIFMMGASYPSVGRLYTEKAIIGSCVSIGGDQHLTAGHCIPNDGVYTLEYPEATIQATLTVLDKDTDIAVLKGRDVSPATIGDTPKIGDKLIAVGYPGITNRRKVAMKHVVTSVGKDIHTKGRLYKGQSGGGLFDESGELVGIISRGTQGTSAFGNVTSMEDVRLFGRCRRQSPQPKPKVVPDDKLGSWNGQRPEPTPNVQSVKPKAFWTPLLLPSAIMIIILLLAAVFSAILNIKGK